MSGYEHSIREPVYGTAVSRVGAQQDATLSVEGIDRPYYGG
jgi:hypothetical protein